MVAFFFYWLMLAASVNSRHKPERINISLWEPGFAVFQLFPKRNKSSLCFPVGRWHLVGSASHPAPARPATGLLLGHRVCMDKRLCSPCRGTYKTHEDSKRFESKSVSRLIVFWPTWLKGSHCLGLFCQEVPPRSFSSPLTDTQACTFMHVHGICKITSLLGKTVLRGPLVISNDSY